MKDESKTRKQLIEELKQLRRQVTKLEKLESGIMEAQEDKERILNLSSDLICIADMDGFFKYANPA